MPDEAQMSVGGLLSCIVKTLLRKSRKTYIHRSLGVDGLLSCIVKKLAKYYRDYP